MKSVFAIGVNDAEIQGSQGGNYGKFGLNTGKITEFALIEDKGKDGTAYKAVSINVKIGDGEQKKLLFLSQDVYETGKEFGTAKMLSPGMEGYEEAFYAHYIQYVAIIKQVLHAFGVTDEQINAAVAGLDSSKFLEGIAKLIALAPANYKELPVDVFLEYEWSIREGKDKTYATLPKNMKGGHFIVKHEPGVWKEVKDDSGLHYVNETGQKHPFVRNSNFMNSNKAIQQTLQPVAAPTLPAANQSSAW